jgi:type IV secretory pathway VirJ component
MQSLKGFKVILLLIAFTFSGDLDMPGIIEIPSNGSGKTMAVLYTGDGGWKATDRGLARVLSDNGIPLVAVNSLRYFWHRRTPEGAADDFLRLLKHYLAAWKKDKFIVVGYSYGADVLPFIVARLPKDLLPRLELVALLSPTQSVDFEFHLMQWISNKQPKTAKLVLPELEKLRGIRIVAFCGDQDGKALCRDLPPGSAKTIILHSGHRFDNFCKPIAQDILKEMQSKRE